MPMKLNVGISKKQGLPNYGSVGASCHVEVELDGSLLRDDLDRFHDHARNVLTACRQAVNDELSRQQGTAASGSAQSDHRPESHAQPVSQSNGHPANGNGNNGHRASQRQQIYISQLAGLIPGLDSHRLESLSQAMFGKPLVDLVSTDASALIDTLKAIKDGQATLEDILNGVPT